MVQLSPKEETHIMRIGGFMLGAAAGLAAAVYVSRKRPGMAAWASSSLASACSSIGKSAASMMMKRGLNKAVEASTIAPKHSDDTAGKQGGGWEQVEQLINSDPGLKEQASQIMAESSFKPH
ncbi:hypothetical protein M3194_08595 [Paenibacillus glycanilyticus]|uniref:hypothetical protein n=1 Tax=Paenibacillus glycanilyticus TaxID=126569 RepID=UPI0020414EA2|nr:hypothetical protein [Paenibacillus glycanilyticus]MCM3627422.1 hypothetical protein [Paenibacillus glycanilyticus]